MPGNFGEFEKLEGGPLTESQVKEKRKHFVSICNSTLKDIEQFENAQKIYDVEEMFKKGTLSLSSFNCLCQMFRSGLDHPADLSRMLQGDFFIRFKTLVEKIKQHGIIDFVSTQAEKEFNNDLELLKGTAKASVEYARKFIIEAELYIADHLPEK